MNARGRLAGVAVAGLLPWVVVVGAGPGTPVSLVFSFGLVNPAPLHLVTLPDYLLVFTSGLPTSLLGWAVATLLWAVALVSGLVGLAAAREDRRLTGGLLVLAGLSLLPVAAVVGRPPGVTAVPVGTLVLWTVAWWAYDDALRRIGTPRER